MQQEEINKWLERHKKAKAKKDRWNHLWQYCGEYVNTLKQDFTELNDEGQFLVEDLYDSTAPKANARMAASLLGLLWVSGGKSIRIKPAKKLDDTAEIKRYFDFVSESVTDALDDPKAGLAIALEEYMQDQGSLGTSGIGTFKGDESDLRFESWGIDEIAIEEGNNGYVRTIFREYEWTINRAVEEYGLKKLSAETQQKYSDGKGTDKIKFVHIIAPRIHGKKNAKSNKEMPFLSIRLEKDSKHEIKESGFQEMPVAMARFLKRRKEVYGRSPAMFALPDILEINEIKKARSRAMEKTLDPPLGVYDDSILGNEEIDTSAGGISVFAQSGRLGNKQPIFPLFTVETIREADKSIEDLIRSINEHFHIDRLLDFNNETQMTLGEAQLRNKIRSESLGSLFTRQVAETFTPMIERSVAILYRNNKLGVVRGSDAANEMLLRGEEPMYIPEAVQEVIEQGGTFYEIYYLTPAARMMETAEAEGVNRAWEFALGVAQANPTVLDNLDADESLKIISRNSGAPNIIIRDEETVEQIRAQRAQQEQEMAEKQKFAEEQAIIQQTAQTEKEAKEAANIPVDVA